MLSMSFEFTDSDEMGQMESNHHDHNARQSRGGNQPKPINTLDTINSVLLRKTALSKLSR